MTDRRLELARRLHALARTGLHFCASEYDRERYEEIERIAAELLAGSDAGPSLEELLGLWRHEQGYVTPKVECAARLQYGRVLLVWGEPTASDAARRMGRREQIPAQAVEKEIEQESSAPAQSSWRHLRPQPARARRVTFHGRKAFFLCEIQAANCAAVTRPTPEFFDVDTAADVARPQHPRPC
jgi:hypothetical protein